MLEKTERKSIFFEYHFINNNLFNLSTFNKFNALTFLLNDKCCI